MSIRTQIFSGQSRIGSLSPLLHSSIYYTHRKLTWERHMHQKPTQLHNCYLESWIFHNRRSLLSIHFLWFSKIWLVSYILSSASKVESRYQKHHIQTASNISILFFFSFLSAAKRPVVSPVVEQLAILLSVIQHVILDHSIWSVVCHQHLTNFLFLSPTRTSMCSRMRLYRHHWNTQKQP